MKLKLVLLIGTMTGTADCVAQAIQMDLADWDVGIELMPMDGLDIGIFDEAQSKDALYIV